MVYRSFSNFSVKWKLVTLTCQKNLVNFALGIYVLITESCIVGECVLKLVTVELQWLEHLWDRGN